MKCANRFFRASLPLFFAADLRQPQKVERGDGARCRFSTVVIVLHPQYDAGVFTGCAEVTAALLVEKQAVLGLLQFNGELQPFDVEGSSVKIEQSLYDECVIVGKPFDFASAISITAKQCFLRLIPKMRANKSRGSRRAFKVTRFIEYLRRTRVGRDHEAIPRCDDFVVEMRARPVTSDRQ